MNRIIGTRCRVKVKCKNCGKEIEMRGVVDNNKKIILNDQMCAWCGQWMPFEID